jgi:peptidoglycan hydrolase CwlO-like protein
VALAAVACVLTLRGVSSPPSARAASVGGLQSAISAGKSTIAGLASQVQAASSRVSQLTGSIGALESRLAKLQADLNAKRAELSALRHQLARARKRLAELEAFEAHAETVLAHQLVSGYETDHPDIVTVVLDSTGFQDLLEKLTFAQRIRNQDVQIVREVRAARRAVAAEAIRLGALEVRQRALTLVVVHRVTELNDTKVALVRQELAAARSRDAKATRLAGAKAHVDALQQQLNQLQAAQAAAAARAAQQAAQPAAQPAVSTPSSSSSGSPSSGSSSGGSPPPSAPPSSGGGFVFPLPRSAASPPGSWSPDDGVDISAPGDTPEYAVCSGTIVLHGIGGFGPWAPVLHCDSPVGGYDYVYYGHAGPLNQLGVGTHVSAGAVMSSVGPGIVGISTGPHLEIGFADSSGSPIGPGSAGTMMSLLQGSY